MIRIDVVSDVACPWCYVGMKRLQKAIEAIPEIEVDIHWQPFQLDPTIPAGGRETKSYYITKFGSEEKVNQIFDHMETVGNQEGIDFNFADMTKTMNSFNLHVLMAAANVDGEKTKLKERFFKAYFEDRIDLSLIPNLVSIMSDFGWESTKVHEVLENSILRAEVTETIKMYQSKGVS